MASTSPVSVAAGARLRDERGLSMIEVVAAALLLALGVGSALLALAAPQRQSYGAQRVALASAIAERDLNQLAGSTYANICTTTPTVGSGTLTNTGKVSSASPTTPTAFLSSNSTSFLALTQYNNIPLVSGSYDPSGYLLNSNEPATGETLVTGPSANCFAATASLPGTSGATGTIYRYVTYVDGEECGPNLGTTLTTLIGNNTGVLAVGKLLNELTSKLGPLGGGTNIFCTAANNEKRITDAVVLNAGTNGVGPSLPVYMTTMVPNPSGGVLAGSPITTSCTIALGAVGICS